MAEAGPERSGIGWSDRDVEGRYRVDVLPWAAVADDGVQFREGVETRLLPWSRVQFALAAQVGEAEGVSTVVFDLVVERKHTDVLVCRFDADPGDSAQEVARQLLMVLGRERCSRSLADLAAEAVPSRCYEDLESLAAGSLEDLGL